MSNVVGLRGGEIRAPGEPDPLVVEGLEELLEAARSGEIKGIAVASLHHDGAVSGRRHGYQNYTLIGIMTRMINDISSAIG
ncbi:MULTISPECIES: hypothetical protein [unclassified Bradyrhizobium]|uniref:hypothetical protein n=1 Tax=unclassified Bradyrhizobium TaxID=2631580 RepID=UPI00247AFB5E|nr:MULTISPECIES: hypothetical protein [unclassified Bradyrhizobium]WGR74331.1 hypothetical protein MTX24_16535 [Bradyrhizobium sp. ISRA426]WGR79166.1 hypothetical protein MTX21_01650 [Bradyrhizobium sp. ISRA430]WGR90587.1 hypothetical protein MTX25_39795 [Bradyrhizobium sp. ISRA432]